MFIDTSSNRGYVKEVVNEFGFDLIDPEVFIKFLNNDMYFETWQDVEREMIARRGNNFSIDLLKREYRLCALYLYNRGYTDINRNKL